MEMSGLSYKCYLLEIVSAYLCYIFFSFELIRVLEYLLGDFIIVLKILYINFLAKFSRNAIYNLYHKRSSSLFISHLISFLIDNYGITVYLNDMLFFH